MQKGLIGKKIGMTQIFDESGKVVPVTVVEAGPCAVITKKTAENDGYEAVQLGFGDVKAQRVNKPMKGHFEKQGAAPVRPKRFSASSVLRIAPVLTAATFSRLMSLRRAISSMSSVPARVRERPARSSAGTSPA